MISVSEAIHPVKRKEKQRTSLRISQENTMVHRDSLLYMKIQQNIGKIPHRMDPLHQIILRLVSVYNFQSSLKPCIRTTSYHRTE